MIARVLTTADEADAETFLRTLHPANAVYFLERLLGQGVDGDHARFFGVFADEAGLQALAMLDLVDQAWRVSWRSEVALPALKALIQKDPMVADCLVGQQVQTQPLFEFLDPTVFMGVPRYGRMWALRVADYRPSYKPEVRPRRAVVEDAEGILALDEKAVDRGLSAREAALARYRLRCRDYSTYVAEAEGRIVAWAGVSIEFAEAANVTDVRTHPEYRGRGYCQACMSALCDDLFKRVALIYLSVADVNVSAVSCYSALGFEPLGDDINPRVYFELSPATEHGRR